MILKLEIGTKANQLEKRAEQFCSALTHLDAVEGKMQATISQLNGYNLISSEKRAYE